MAIKVNKKVQENVNELENMTFNTLKDFQQKTVERVTSLFENYQNRVLVADEVGMGKTMIAKGVIAKMAQIRIKEGDDLFKVVYICSNQAIAKQNIKTLDIISMLPEYANDELLDTSDTRLSMQHLKITEQENDPRLKEKFIQIILLTPGTSFEMSQGTGSIRERALIYAVLKRAKEFKEEFSYFRRIMVRDATSSGYDLLDEYDQEVETASSNSKEKYPENIIKELRKEVIKVNDEEVKLFTFARKVLNDRKERRCDKRSNCYRCPHNEACRTLISELRIALAKISTENLNPDLVIMDEFQRFNSLIDINNNEDSGILAKKFLQENPDDNSRKNRVLLLSATPYKLYTTMEEMDENADDEPYKEFFNVMDFLFEKDRDDFHKKWLEYSSSLQAAQKHGFEVLRTQKTDAENAMYKGTCRTERISVMEDGDYIDDSSKDKHLKITEGDIKSYVQMQKVFNDTCPGQNVPVDYVKSCPYLMSFMEKYKLKDNIKKAFVDGTESIFIDNETIWLNRNNIENYKEIPDNNARLTQLKDFAFQNNAENLLWIPPCRPYYNLEGSYKGITNFTKTLVFSSWEMVPRMISTLLSYELERKIYGKKFKYSDERKIARRLEFRLNKKQEPGAMNLFSLIYPSETLADLYDPVDCMNRKLNLSEIENEIKSKISEKLEKLKSYETTKFVNAIEASNRWYYFAPMLMDNNLEHAKKWLEVLKSEKKKDEESEDNRFSNYLETLEKLINSENSLGKMPKDLKDYLCDVALGSFAVCYYRSCRKYNDSRNTVLSNATSFAKEFIKNFNAAEFIAVVDNQYGQNKDASYLQNVLHYCKDGCFQGMLDEYINLLQRNDNGTFQQDLINNISLLQTSHYEIDTKEAFLNDVINEQRKLEAKKNEKIEELEVRSKKINMRSHFAVCFSKIPGKNEGERKENLRNAFNSPLWPFVLASTSIGQEGLDFHNYCRRIMHWNLPSNPIDLEQREGRINRYKCLAIRQNVAQKYGNEEISDNLWKEMFEKAEIGEKGEEQSELIPFWCFGKNQKIKIERIVSMYPMSSDINRYERLIKILSLYRMTLGQPRQEELLEYIFSNFTEDEQKKMKDLFIDLSPWNKTKKRGGKKIEMASQTQQKLML